MKKQVDYDIKKILRNMVIQNRGNIVPYNFSNLNYADFEDLARDLIGEEISVRFEGFTEGRDGGIDGRHAKGKHSTILQAKHYAGSKYPTLKNKMKEERKAIDKLNPSRYILVTSHPLTPLRKKGLAEIIGSSLKSESDIFGPTDLNALIRKFPNIERAHIKLWLTGTGVLERVIYAASHSYNNITMDEIKAKLKVFAQNPSLEHSQKILEDNHVLIISGPPGVGKTTLAEILSYAHAAEGWNLNVIRNIDDGFAKIGTINDKERQIFLFDDFLGKIALDRHSLAQKDSDLSKFIRRIRESPNARFILTTRAYIFEEARRVSEYLDDKQLNIIKYVLNVDIYTRNIKARILYNHLLEAKLPTEHIRALIEDNTPKEIVDHKNYNPRIIEWMTNATQIKNTTPENYKTDFIGMLNNPSRLWDKAFREHIPKKCQHLLLALFFSSEYGVDLEDLRLTYNALHPHLCSKYGKAHNPKDFEESLKILEGGFIKIFNRNIGFINPSLRDYLKEYLNDYTLICEFPPCAQFSDWAKELWRYGEKLIDPSTASLQLALRNIWYPERKTTKQQDDIKNFALSFLSIAEKFLVLPTFKRSISNSGGSSLSITGLSNTDRLKLLLAWWNTTKDIRFANLALLLAEKPVEGLSSWRDGSEAIELIHQIRDGDYYEDFPFSNELANRIEAAYIIMLGRSIPSDDLESISDSVESYKNYLSESLIEAAEAAIFREIEDVQDIVSEIDSDSTLDDYVIMLNKLAKRAHIDDKDIKNAIKIVQYRITQLQEEEEISQSRSPSFNSPNNSVKDNFDDLALHNLFITLLDKSLTK